MSLFGTSPPNNSDLGPPSMSDSFARSRHSIFDDDVNKSSNSLFDDDEDDDGAAGARFESPWDMPTPRKQQTRADLIKNLLPTTDVPDSYIEAFDAALRYHGGSSGSGRVGPEGLMRTLTAARIGPEQSRKILDLVAPSGGGEGPELGRNEFNVFLALIGLAQEREPLSLDGVDERRRDLPKPKLLGLLSPSSADQDASLPGASDLPAKTPQRPVTPPSQQSRRRSQQGGPAEFKTPTQRQRMPRSSSAVPPMEYPDDPWSAPDLHKTHNHAAVEPPPRSNNLSFSSPQRAGLNGTYGDGATTAVPSSAGGRTTSAFTTASASEVGSPQVGADPASRNMTSGAGSGAEGWDAGYFENNPSSAAPTFSDPSAGSTLPTSPFSGNNVPGSAGRLPGGVGGGGVAIGGSGSEPHGHARAPSRTIGNGGRTGSAIEENVLVTLMPEKEGLFMFQHHNYEVTSTRRGSKVIRRYSDFVWLLDCLHKRYPFRVLPLLPPKRVAVNGNHLSNDGAFIEKRRRGLARFLNALVRHPVLSPEQLVVMFLTVPTELSVWRKQATISVQDEFAGRSLPPHLEESLSPQLEDLFTRTRTGVRRSAELYIGVCNIMDRLVKRTEGVAADHARIALSLNSLTETSADCYATDTQDVPLLNDGLASMAKHLRTSQGLMEDESRAWDAGVLEDLKRQRDALVAVRDLFDRRDRLDRDNIPALERRIAANETKLAGLRAKPEGLVKPGEIEKVVEAIIKDKQSIVDQHNRSVFVRECIRDELVTFQSTQYHVSRWNQDWAQERVKYAEMLADNWRRLLDELDGMPTGE